MKRIISIWMNRWETDRFFRAHREAFAASADSKTPFALTESGAGGERLCALTSAAEALGLCEGVLLTDARALVPALRTAPREFDAAQRDLEALARWCERYAPHAAIDPPDGILLDITGCAHLFGGEQDMLADIAARLQAFHFQARLGVADTPGAAFAAARYARQPRAIIPPGRQAAFLAALPVEALRIDARTAEQLRELGLTRIGRLAGMPRAPLAARFGAALMLRLDQAMGREDEPISPLSPRRRYSARAVFPEPISLLNDLERIAGDLARAISAQLQAGGCGARTFTLKLFGADGSLREIAASSARPLFQSRQIALLFRERIHAIEPVYDEGVGVDAVSLEATQTETIEAKQALLPPEETQDGEALSFLLDRLAARLGPDAIVRLVPHESHIPERAQKRGRPGQKGDLQSWRGAPRPLLLLARPEPVDVVAEIPDGPPAHFTWRRVRRRVAFADGPERIASEWWREDAARTRDYFRVEDSEHRRYWLFREGLYGRETQSARWFMHGIFA